MKAEAIKSIGNVITRAISGSAKAEAAPVSHAVKGGEKLMAAGQDAAAVQGRAMVKPYAKPEMTEVKMEKKNLKAASGFDNNSTDGGFEEPVSSSSKSFWDEDYWDSNDVWGN